MLKRLKCLCKTTFLQLAELLLASNDALENNILPINATHQLMFTASAFLAKFFQPFVEIPMSLEDHPKVFRATLNEELERRHPV